MAFLTFLIVTVVLLCSGGERMCGSYAIHLKEDWPRDILHRRYARGEISQEEYQRMRKEIQ